MGDMKGQENQIDDLMHMQCVHQNQIDGMCGHASVYNMYVCRRDDYRV